MVIPTVLKTVQSLQMATSCTLSMGKTTGTTSPVKPYFIHQRSNPEVDVYRRIYSPGVLLTGKSDSLFYKAEGTYQFGQESDDEAHLAWMGVGELGYQKDDSNFLPMVKSTLEMVIPTMMSATTLKGSSEAIMDCEDGLTKSVLPIYEITV